MVIFHMIHDVQFMTLLKAPTSLDVRSQDPIETPATAHALARRGHACDAD